MSKNSIYGKNFTVNIKIAYCVTGYLISSKIIDEFGYIIKNKKITISQMYHYLYYLWRNNKELLPEFGTRENNFRKKIQEVFKNMKKQDIVNYINNVIKDLKIPLLQIIEDKKKLELDEIDLDINTKIIGIKNTDLIDVKIKPMNKII